MAFQADMNKPECELAFLVGKEIIFVEHEGERITRSAFATMGEHIKLECSCLILVTWFSKIQMSFLVCKYFLNLV